MSGGVAVRIRLVPRPRSKHGVRAYLTRRKSEERAEELEIARNSTERAYWEKLDHDSAREHEKALRHQERQDRTHSEITATIQRIARRGGRALPTQLKQNLPVEEQIEGDVMKLAGGELLGAMDDFEQAAERAEEAIDDETLKPVRTPKAPPDPQLDSIRALAKMNGVDVDDMLDDE